MSASVITPPSTGKKKHYQWSSDYSSDYSSNRPLPKKPVQEQGPACAEKLYTTDVCSLNKSGIEEQENKPSVDHSTMEELTSLVRVNDCKPSKTSDPEYTI